MSVGLYIPMLKSICTSGFANDVIFSLREKGMW